MPSSKTNQAQDEADAAGAAVGGSEKTPASEVAGSGSSGGRAGGQPGGSGKDSSPDTQRGTERHGSQGPSTTAADVQKNSDKYGNVVGSEEEQDKVKSKL